MMTRAATPPLLAELQHPESPAGQVAALRALKHEIVGHDQRKEAWIGWGIVPVVARVLRRGYGKKAAVPVAELNGAKEHVAPTRSRTDEEEACRQATIIVGSLSQGTKLKRCEQNVKEREEVEGEARE
jgi:armadillo repeat-containing protein 8